MVGLGVAVGLKLLWRSLTTLSDIVFVMCAACCCCGIGGTGSGIGLGVGSGGGESCGSE